MSKFHVNAAGVVSACTASVRNCPLGEESHGESRKEVQALYEQRMEQRRLARPVRKPKASTAESLAELKKAGDSPLESAALAEKSVLDAGRLASSYLASLMDPTTRKISDESQGALVHAIVHEQARAVFDLLDAKDAIETGWEGPLGAHPAIPLLESARVHVHAAGKLASARLSKLWDKDARRYRDPAQTAFLHDLINVQVGAMNKTRFAARDLAKGL